MEPVSSALQPPGALADTATAAAPHAAFLAAADLTLLVASLAIAGLLVYLFRKRADLPFRWIFALFALFILAIVAAQSLYWVWPQEGARWLPALIEVGVAAVALLTAGYFVRIMPQALRVPSEAALAEVNRRLEIEVVERRHAEGELKRLADDLEQRVEARTSELEAANRELQQQVAERMRAAAALRASQEQLRLALEAAHMGVWEWDIAGNAMHWSERVAALFGLALEQFDGSYDSMMRMVHPEDRARVQALVDDCFDGKTQDFFLAYRVVRRDGGVRWLEARGRLYRDDNGEPVRMAGLTADVTERKLSELALQESEERYRSLIAALAEGVMLFAPDGRCLAANESAGRILGLTQQELLNAPLSSPEWRTIRPDGTPFPASEYPAVRTLQTGEPCREVLMGLERDDGDLRWLSINTQPLFRNAESQPHAVVASFVDVTTRFAAESALRESEEKFSAVFRISPEPVTIASEDDGVYVDVNEAFARLLGYTREQVIGRSSLDLGIWVDALQRRELVRRLQQYGLVEEFEAMIRRADGEIRIARMSCGPLELKGRRCLVAVLRDVTLQKAQEEELRLAARVFESTAEGILITDPVERIVAVNSAFSELTGYTEEEVRGRQPSLLGSGRHDQRFYDEMWNSINRTGRWHGEVWNRTKSGDVRPYLLTITAVRDERGMVLNYVGVMRDISTIKQSQQQLEYLANYDALTGLGNRNLFYTRLKVGIEKAARHRRQLAVIFVDLDNFKMINDTLGHDVGDVLLSEVARRIKTCVRQEDVVCRLGGDEFTVYVEDFAEPQALVGTAQRLTQVIGEPYHTAGHDIFVTASVGISVYPNDGQTMSELLKNADTAMYKAKEQGKNGFQFFREDMNARAFERLVFVSGLRRALDRGEFRLVYQPQVQLSDRRVRGAECLLRWSHPDMGEVSPGSFIPVAEETGLIVPIGEWVIREACRQLKEWGGQAVRLNLNLSARQFRQPELVDFIRDSMQAADLGPGALGVELTESALIDDPENAAATLTRLKDMGLTVSMDDFGTGYSSLSYLKRFPIDSLKIDRAFVRDIAVDPDDAAIVTAIITMAQSLKLDVVAEGVETEEQVAFLRARGCNAAQGYYFGKPLPAERVDEWLFRKQL